MSHQETLTLYVSTFIQQLIHGGVTKAVISPGSRSTPLAYLLQDHPQIDCHVNVDERSAAFYALGMAKVSGRPVVLVCTSGTAAANYYPAVVEAHYARIPLLVLTADRPHELREVGAPQAINQIHLFGQHVKWFSDMAIPEDRDSVIQHVSRSAVKALAKAMDAPMGPVHLNFPFREPLSPVLGQWKTAQTQTPVSIMTGEKTISEKDAVRLSKQVNEAEKGMIIAGPTNDPHATQALLNLADKTGFPLLADPLSHLRSELYESNALIEGYDAFLKSDEIKKLLKPDFIIRFGAMPVSKPLLQFLSPLNDVPHLLVDQGTDWRDPLSSVTEYIDCDEKNISEAISSRADRDPAIAWLDLWKKINQTSIEEIERHTQNEKDEGAVIGRILRSLPANCHVMAGNSMPIRDLDTFWTRHAGPFTLWANRGANGIDGVVSAALGIAAETMEPVYLIIGDLSLFHDLNGLLVAKQHPVNLHIIVLNNNGGGIFSFLPQAAEPVHFETLFGTPPSLDFSHAAKLYSLFYQKLESIEDVEAGIEGLQNEKGVTITEILTDRNENVQVHRALWEKVKAAVSGVL
ncbi:2-succinyl-5-enolpyruvyl-6-hydroxy-3-cyclohexene-1-carboxylic-acid synthase [Jeotgalibacillus campisalis]|uniref:2-succinyl-5-enolpyruvyl-6-hydroxy-3-cyclohexene-1-carboxylate synthase n=1 Tax=Jeotgalibacillus campisalis TaxID=220754 RepID=A0A0C2VNI3_9BACL|nr:2-succinyl-5-enolpyruvyl-6-hydroxy-3-cyclohexene-1-carboxylic-acid synthase [Jeotgalibacillus campisalis]KIL45553.1 2-succinyl-5-enolpyruvyl-6-hydroxy-3-cyclohexene-1-carboxylic-acid synthase [Jeotgalibacillus campisalis]